MPHRFVPIDFANLMDAIGIADERGGRIRLSDRRAVEAFLAENGLDAGQFAEFVAARGLPMAAIVASGLMKGLYAYSLESKEAFLYIASDQGFAPLRPYPEEMCYDIALSYACEEVAQLVRPLKKALEDHGVSVYFLDIDDDRGEPLWPIRFREGLFHSRYFVPLLTEGYLAREGSALEMFDIARAAVEHRGDEFFYPLLPLVRDSGELHRVLSGRGVAAKRYDDQGFEWMRTHVFSLPLSRGIPWLARFFTSLVRNARGSFDSDFLQCLAPSIEWLELIGTGPRHFAKFLIRNPVLTYHNFVMSGDGQVRYMGMGEPGTASPPGTDFPDRAGAILEWLGLQPPGKETQDVSPGIGADEVEPEPVAQPETALPVKIWFCPNCHHTGPPEWRKQDRARLQELGIVLRHEAGLPMCPVCGRTTMLGRD